MSSMPPKKAKRNVLPIVYRKVSDLVPYENNAKIHEEDVDIPVIAENIKRYGWLVPMVIDKDNVIVCGHGRRLAMYQLKRENEEVPCVFREDLTDEQLRTFRLSENKSNELAGYDFELYDLELGELKEQGIELTQLGFDLDNYIDTDGEETPLTDEEIEDLETTEDTSSGENNQSKMITCPHCGQQFPL